MTKNGLLKLLTAENVCLRNHKSVFFIAYALKAIQVALGY